MFPVRAAISAILPVVWRTPCSVAAVSPSSIAANYERRNAPVKPTSSSAQSRRSRRSSEIGPAARAKRLASRRVLLRVRRVAANACHGLGNVGGVGREGEAGGPVQQADCEKADAGCLLPLPPGTSVNRTSASTKKFSVPLKVKLAVSPSSSGCRSRRVISHGPPSTAPSGRESACFLAGRGARCSPHSPVTCFHCRTGIRIGVRDGIKPCSHYVEIAV